MDREVNVINFNEGTLNINVEGNVKVSKAYSEKENITVVQLEKTTKYIPKYGDIIHLGQNKLFRGERLCIFNKEDGGYYRTLFSIYLADNFWDWDNRNANERPIRLATEEECEVVFKKLKELGKKWNPTTKLIEDIYVPQNGDFVFFKSTGKQFEDVSIFNKKVGDKYYTYFSVYKKDSKVYNHIDDTCVHIDESHISELRRANPEEIKFLLDKLKEEKLSWNVETQILSRIEEFKPKDGDIIYVKLKNDTEYICIFKVIEGTMLRTYCDKSLPDGTVWTFAPEACFLSHIDHIKDMRIATEEQKKILFDGLASRDKYWNKEEKVLEDIPKVGDLYIFWDNTTSLAMVSVLKKISKDEEYPYIACTDVIYTNCTKYISKEQYLDFIK